jgi:hypothetical protein
MDVHYHPHDKDSKGNIWLHRFYDFFMLFLAVTLGFFVENLREHSVENNRERVYMRMLRDDLKGDIRELNRVADARLQREKQLDTLVMLLGEKNLQPKASEIYRLVDITDSYESFLRNDRTIEQLKTAGGMRMIRKDTVSDGIMDYDNFIISEIDWNNRTEATRIDYYKQLRFQLFDAQSLFHISRGDTATSNLLPATAGTINLVAGAVFQVKRISETNRQSGELARERAAKLIELIEKNYHIK